jgi:hypothetical protein
MENLHPADGMLHGDPNAGMMAIAVLLLFRQFRVRVVFGFSRPFARQRYLGLLAIFLVGPLKPEVEPQFLAFEAARHSAILILAFVVPPLGGLFRRRSA